MRFLLQKDPHTCEVSFGKQTRQYTTFGKTAKLCGVDFVEKGHTLLGYFCKKDLTNMGVVLQKRPQHVQAAYIVGQYMTLLSLLQKQPDNVCLFYPFGNINPTMYDSFTSLARIIQPHMTFLPHGPYM